MGKGITRGRRADIAVSSKNERECERVEATDLADRVYANQRYGTDQEEREASICKEILDKNQTEGKDLRGFFERILSGRRVHWARIFHELVWVSASSGWAGPLVNHLTPFLVHFYRGMGLLTREELRRFPREREILRAESSEGTEDDTRQPSIPPQTTAQGPVQVDVMRRREKPERRLAKRRKVVSDDKGNLVLEVRRTETEVGVNRQTRFRARSKQRANRGLVAAEASDSSVEKMVAPIMYEAEAAVGEQRQPVEVERSSEVLIEVPADMPTKSLKEGVEIVSPNSLSSERTRFARGEETPQLERNKELMKEPTLSEEILGQVVAQLNLEKEAGRCAELEETCVGLPVSNENAQKVTVDLLSRLDKSKEVYEEAVKRSERLIVTAEKQEKKYIEDLAKMEARRAEKVCIAKELQGKIAKAKTAEEDLRRKISEIANGEVAKARFA
ncbi:hypothetical protein AXG93_4891s1030 [Marchantia polymorpha subsp. ruderalis]|uniref:Uncharacterized protein n=1 Tax=Marchantia polymorpha subsp. ruderalis TaxID=1480154 RepID=A0A176W7E1_MARPO|nr:hypothetical protein AXG93_4891s1030 [Marchantia polymorpha subsp. ruderalis]